VDPRAGSIHGEGRREKRIRLHCNGGAGAERLGNVWRDGSRQPGGYARPLHWCRRVFVVEEDRGLERAPPRDGWGTGGGADDVRGSCGCRRGSGELAEGCGAIAVVDDDGEWRGHRVGGVVAWGFLHEFGREWGRMGILVEFSRVSVDTRGEFSRVLFCFQRKHFRGSTDEAHILLLNYWAENYTHKPTRLLLWLHKPRPYYTQQKYYFLLRLKIKIGDFVII
jgi:hypothetical protein